LYPEFYLSEILGSYLISGKVQVDGLTGLIGGNTLELEDLFEVGAVVVVGYVIFDELNL